MANQPLLVTHHSKPPTLGCSVRQRPRNLPPPFLAHQPNPQPMHLARLVSPPPRTPHQPPALEHLEHLGSLNRRSSRHNPQPDSVVPLDRLINSHRSKQPAQSLARPNQPSPPSVAVRSPSTTISERAPLNAMYSREQLWCIWATTTATTTACHHRHKLVWPDSATTANEYFWGLWLVESVSIGAPF